MKLDLNTFIIKELDTFPETRLTVATSFRLWSVPGHFDLDLIKGPISTSWIWDLHSYPHDFDLQLSS